MDFMTLAKERYSVRDYKDTPIEEEKLQKILEAGRIAPTAKNNQAYRVYVLKSEAAVAKIRELSRCAFNAPIVKDEEWFNTKEEDYRSGQEDASIVATHMMLQAQELEIGSCWVNVFPPSEVIEAFDIPANERPVLLMPIGYPSDKSVPSERHTLYRDMEELVKVL